VFLNKKEDGTTKKINEMNNRIRENIKKKKNNEKNTSDKKDGKRRKKGKKDSDCRVF
jgi:hypothetical protein